MAKELERYRDEVYILTKLGELKKVYVNSLEDYNHSTCELHHFIPYSAYIGNENWYKERGIKQKLIVVSKRLHEDIENRGIKTLTDEEFKQRYKISRWELIFNKKHSKY